MRPRELCALSGTIATTTATDDKYVIFLWCDDTHAIQWERGSIGVHECSDWNFFLLARAAIGSATQKKLDHPLNPVSVYIETDYECSVSGWTFALPHNFVNLSDSLAICDTNVRTSRFQFRNLSACFGAETHGQAIRDDYEPHTRTPCKKASFSHVHNNLGHTIACTRIHTHVRHMRLQLIIWQSERETKSSNCQLKWSGGLTGNDTTGKKKKKKKK